MRAVACLAATASAPRLVDVSGTMVAVACRRLAAGRPQMAVREAAVRDAARTLGLPGVERLRLASLLPSGRPIGLVDGVRAPGGISISHVGDWLAVAVADRATVGIDLVDSASAGRGLDHWFDAAQRDLAEAVDAGCGVAGCGRAALWAGREAAFKAAALDAPFAPAAIQVFPELPWGWPLPDLHDDHLPAALAAWTWRVTADRRLRGTARIFDCGVPDTVMLLAIAVLSTDSSQE